MSRSDAKIEYKVSLEQNKTNKKKGMTEVVVSYARVHKTWHAVNKGLTRPTATFGSVFPQRAGVWVLTDT